MLHLQRFPSTKLIARFAAGCALLVTTWTVALPPASAATPRSITLVPLVKCPTGDGVGRAPVVLPPTLAVAISPGAGSRLSFYGDDEGLLHIIGPRGWACQAGVGVDGDVIVNVFPRGEIKGQDVLPASAEAVSGSLEFNCHGCALDEACPLFPAAKRLDGTDDQGGCSPRPGREVVYRVSPTIVAFLDPPWVKGDGYPSGGPYPANGVMSYLSDEDSAHTYWETCTLPTADHGLCTVALNEFLSLYPLTPITS
jgi:hypothetical protein